MDTFAQQFARHRKLFSDWAKEAERLANRVGTDSQNWRFAQARARLHEQKIAELVEEMGVRVFDLRGAPEGPTRKLTRG